MSTSKNNLNLGIKIYLPVSLFCLFFFLVYDRFSHGVRSPYMTWLFLWPSILGLLPSLILQLFPKLPRQNRLSADLYHPGVAAVTVSSLLRGIFEIAGTASDYQTWLMIFGGVLLVCGVAAYAMGKQKEGETL